MLAFPSPRNNYFDSQGLLGSPGLVILGNAFHTHSFQNLGFNAYLLLIWVFLSVPKPRDIYFMYGRKQNFNNIEWLLFLVSGGSNELYFDLKSEWAELSMDSVLLFYSGIHSCFFISVWEADLSLLDTFPYTRELLAGDGRPGAEVGVCSSHFIMLCLILLLVCGTGWVVHG